MIKQKFLELKIRSQVWWTSLGPRARVGVLSGLGALGLLVLGLIGYGVFSYFKWNSSSMAIPWVTNSLPAKIPTPSPETPKTFASPLNGALRTQEEADVFMSRRPLAVMVNNHPDARPQFGLSKADVVYEAVAEGGITRFLAVFHSQNAEQVGPVRSARVYYEDWAAEYNAWYAHWGGAYMDAADKANQNNPSYEFTCNPAADAYAKINRINLPSLDQMWLGSAAYWRDNSRGVATEHTGFTSTEKLWTEAPKKYPGWEGFMEFRQWEFKDDVPAQAPTGVTAEFNFWEMPAFAVKWEYDPATNSYKRYQGGTLQVDAGADNTPLLAKNVVLQFTTESSFNDKKSHLNYKTVGEGTAKILRDGLVVDAIWKKGGISNRTIYYDSSGKEIQFNRGQIWIEIVPDRNIDAVKIN